jgi:antitoxin MazE
MRVTVSRWGNSLGVRIPRAVAEDARITEGSLVDVRVEDGRIVAVPVEAELTLESLLAGITRNNLHPEQPDDRSREREAW